VAKDRDWDFGDGWDHRAGPDDFDDLPPRLATTVRVDHPRTIIARNTSPDVPFDRSINPYRGCEHGCVYCFARPTHEFLGLSAGLDFETKLVAKPDAPALLTRELAKPRYKCAPLALGTNTDPYQPIERDWKITRGILQVLAAANHPVIFVTKSNLIVRDLDIVGPMAGRNLAAANLSITTLDRHLARTMEPRAATPQRRLDAVRALADAGVPTGVMVAPVIPGLNDSEIEGILEAAAKAGATSAAMIMVRLPHGVKDLFADWLTEHFPDRRDRVLGLIRDIRGGDESSANFFERQSGSGPVAAMIKQRFAAACRRLGLNRSDVKLDTSQFVPPDLSGQLGLFS
jgi:DNA repair photolyase